MTLAKTADHLIGVQDELKCPHLRSHNHHRSISSEVSTNLKVEGLLPDLSAGVASPEVGEEHESNTVKPSQVAGTSD
jgi:hypothetical protein